MTQRREQTLLMKMGSVVLTAQLNLLQAHHSLVHFVIPLRTLRTGRFLTKPMDPIDIRLLVGSFLNYRNLTCGVRVSTSWMPSTGPFRSQRTRGRRGSVKQTEKKGMRLNCQPLVFLFAKALSAQGISTRWSIVRAVKLVQRNEQR